MSDSKSSRECGSADAKPNRESPWASAFDDQAVASYVGRPTDVALPVNELKNVDPQPSHTAHWTHRCSVPPGDNRPVCATRSSDRPKVSRCAGAQMSER